MLKQKITNTVRYSRTRDIVAWICAQDGHPLLFPVCVRKGEERYRSVSHTFIYLCHKYIITDYILIFSISSTTCFAAVHTADAGYASDMFPALPVSVPAVWFVLNSSFDFDGDCYLLCQAVSLHCAYYMKLSVALWVCTGVMLHHIALHWMYKELR